MDEFQDGCHRGYAVAAPSICWCAGAVADMCVLGEPTKLDIITQHFGHPQVKISFDMNKPGRGATFFQVLEEWTTDYQRRKTTAGIVPNVGMLGIRGGRGWDGDQGHLRQTAIYLRIPTPPQEHPVTIKHEIRAFLKKVNEQDPLLNATAEIYATNSGAYIPEDSPLVKIVQEAHRNTFGKEPRIGAVWWHSDATHLNRYGVPTVNYGVSRRKGKGVPEGDHLHVDDLVDMTRVYIDLIVRLCGAQAP